MIVKIKNISNNKLPEYQTEHSAGMDIKVDFSRVTPQNPIKVFGDGEILFSGHGHNVTMLKLAPMSRALVPTGLFIELPNGYEAQVRPRSGLAIKKGLTIINTPGTIDADYRGELFIPLVNLGHEDVWIESGERVAQLVINKYEKVKFEEINELSVTDRKGGFGSTGTK